MNLQNMVDRIISDRCSGSTKIAKETCEFLSYALSSGISQKDLEFFIEEILRAHKPMALLHNCINHFLEGGDPAVFMKDVRKRTEMAGKSTREYMIDKGIHKVLTISSSSAVEETLSEFSGDIFIMESRPMLEGTAMAEKLARKGKDVKVVTDAYGISMAAKGEVDAVLVGADAIYRDMLINKVGTYALSVAAEKSEIEFIAVLTTDKIFPEDVELSEEEIMQFHDPKEISDKVPAVNPYFECTEIRKGIRVFTENGLTEFP